MTEGMPPELQGIVPVNQPRRQTPTQSRTATDRKTNTETKASTAKKTPAKSAKQEAYKRHQQAGKGDDFYKTQQFGLRNIDRDLIEQQFSVGEGAYHPSNKLKQSAQELKRDAQILGRNVGTDPFPPTPYSVFEGDAYEAPHQHMTKLGFKYSRADEVNTLDLDGHRVDIKKFGPSLVRKISEGRRFNMHRCEAYISYLRYVVAALEKCKADGEQYNKEAAEHHRRKDLWEQATEVAELQMSWEAALTDQDRLMIVRDETMANMSNDMKQMVAKEVAKELAKLQKSATKGQVSK